MLKACIQGIMARWHIRAYSWRVRYVLHTTVESGSAWAVGDTRRQSLIIILHNIWLIAADRSVINSSVRETHFLQGCVISSHLISFSLNRLLLGCHGLFKLEVVAFRRDGALKDAFIR